MHPYWSTWQDAFLYQTSEFQFCRFSFSKPHRFYTVNHNTHLACFPLTGLEHSIQKLTCEKMICLVSRNPSSFQYPGPQFFPSQNHGWKTRTIVQISSSFPFPCPFPMRINKNPGGIHLQNYLQLDIIFFPDAPNIN